MSHPYRKPDPLLLLAVFVGFGVIFTTAVQAEGDFGPEETTFDQLAPAQVLGLWDSFRESALQLEPATDRINALAATPVGHLLTGRDMAVARPFGSKGAGLSMSLMEETAPLQERIQPDSPRYETGVYFTLEQRW